MTIQSKVALDRDPLVGPDPTWEQLPAEERYRWLTEIEDFPPPPMLLELMETDLRIENFDVGKLAEKFSGDPVLAGRLIGRANCAAIARMEIRAAAEAVGPASTCSRSSSTKRACLTGIVMVRF